MTIKVMSVFGTRPEAIKMAPLVKALEKDERFESIVAVTAQHREMLDQVLTDFAIVPDYDLNIMQPGQTLADITSRVLTQLGAVITAAKPDVLLVHGDTTTTFSAALAAFYQQVKIGHVEAGLRTWQLYDPFPEEANRQLTDVLADFYFAPTTLSKENLLKEHHPAEHIYITGNTAIDAMSYTLTDEYQHPLLAHLTEPTILVTMHRRENLGEPMAHVFAALRRLASEQRASIIFPMHKNPRVREVAQKYLGDLANVHLIEPLEAKDFQNIASRVTMIMTDSGGVQEEAPSLGVPVLVLRKTTERPEGVAAGTLRLVGTDTETVYQEAKRLLTDEAAYQAMAQARNPYGDGHASERILAALAYEFGQTTTPPADFS